MSWLAKRLEGISRNVIILGFVSLLTDLSGQLVFPLLPLYITSVLGGGPVAVGVVEGAAEATASLLKVVSGYWSDRIRSRKPFVLFGYALSAVMKPVLAFAASWPAILAIRVADRVGKGLRDAPRDAIIAESNGRATVGKAFGFNRALDGLGSVGGALLAVLLLPLFGFTTLFKLAIIPGLVSVAVIFLVKETGGGRAAANGKPRLRFGFSSLPSDLKTFILIATVFTLGNYGYAFLMLQARAHGLDDQRTIMLYALFYLVYALLSTRAGAISDQIGRKPVILAGYALFALLSFGLYLFGGVATTVLAFVLTGVFFALTDGAQRALVADLAPPELKGTALGAFHTFTGLAALPAGYIAGQLWDVSGARSTFLFGAVTAALAALAFRIVLFRPTRRSATPAAI